MRDSVAQIIDDIGRAKALRFRVPADEAARLMLTVWEGEAVRATMAGLDYEDAVPPHERGARPRRAADHRAARGLTLGSSVGVGSQDSLAT